MRSIQVIPVKYDSNARVLSLIDEDTVLVYPSFDWHQDKNSVGLPVVNIQANLERLHGLLKEGDYRRVLLESTNDDVDGTPLFGSTVIPYDTRRYISVSILTLDKSSSATYVVVDSQARERAEMLTADRWRTDDFVSCS